MDKPLNGVLTGYGNDIVHLYVDTYPVVTRISLNPVAARALAQDLILNAHRAETSVTVAAEPMKAVVMQPETP